MLDLAAIRKRYGAASSTAPPPEPCAWWEWYSLDLPAVVEALEEAEALAERRKKALKPFAEVYGRSSQLLHEVRGMSSVPLRHRVVLLSEQSDGSFGYLSIRTFRNARDAAEALEERR